MRDHEAKIRWYRQKRPGNGVGRFHARIVSANGNILFASQPIGYAAKAGMLKACDCVARAFGKAKWPRDRIEEITEPVR